MKAQDSEGKPIIGITIGDINGIGPEIIIKTLSDNRLLSYFTPVIYGSSKILSYYKNVVGINDFNYSQVKNGIQSKRINIYNCWDETVDVKVGESNTDGGKYAQISLSKAVEDLKNGRINALVTSPINKHNIQSETFKFNGHTEYLASAFDAKDYLMLMVSGDLKIALVTGHVPLSKVSQIITKSEILKKIRVFENSLKQDFGILKPKIAVLGLNPHAGDEGILGEEEKKEILPAIEELKKKGKLIFGPHSADGFFGSGSYKKFDGILAMYHDQGLIPFKALSFGSGVNYTAGLPIVRTSPDHGTGYLIAGKNKANPDSFRKSIFLAIDILKQRSESALKTE